MGKEKRNKPGPKEDRLKLEGDWRDIAKKAARKAAEAVARGPAWHKMTPAGR